MRRIPNPVPDLGGTAADPAARTVVAAGRLTPQKGFDLLIDAWVPVAAQHPDWTLRICGGGRKQAALGRRVRRLGLEGSVVLPGVVRPGDGDGAGRRSSPSPRASRGCPWPCWRR